MSKGRPRDVQKERFWRMTIRRWRTSRLSVPIYCQQFGISESNFYAWQRTLAARDAESMPFAAVRVLAEPPLDASGQGAAASLELLLPNQRVLRIAPGFDEATLRQLLPLLEEGSRC